jgi:hypothetical protein
VVPWPRGEPLGQSPGRVLRERVRWPSRPCTVPVGRYRSGPDTGEVWRLRQAGHPDARPACRPVRPDPARWPKGPEDIGQISGCHDGIPGFRGQLPGARESAGPGDAGRHTVPAGPTSRDASGSGPPCLHSPPVVWRGCQDARPGARCGPSSGHGPARLPVHGPGRTPATAPVRAYLRVPTVG